MKQPGILLKSAVVTSSVLLVGAFVLYKAGVFNDGEGAGSLPETAGMIGVAEPMAAVGSSVPDTPDVGKPDASATSPADSTGAEIRRMIRRNQKDTVRGRTVSF